MNATAKGPINLNHYIAAEIRAQRSRLGMTQADVAKRAELAVFSTYPAYERGERAVNGDTLQRIARAMHTTASAILRAAEDAQAEDDAKRLAARDKGADPDVIAPRPHGPRRRTRTATPGSSRTPE